MQTATDDLLALARILAAWVEPAPPPRRILGAPPHTTTTTTTTTNNNNNNNNNNNDDPNSTNRLRVLLDRWIASRPRPRTPPPTAPPPHFTLREIVHPHTSSLHRKYPDLVHALRTSVTQILQRPRVPTPATTPPPMPPPPMPPRSEGEGEGKGEEEEVPAPEGVQDDYTLDSFVDIEATHVPSDVIKVFLGASWSSPMTFRDTRRVHI